MSTAHFPRTAADRAQVAQGLFNAKIRSLIPLQNRQHFLAVDVNTGEFESDEDDYTAINKLLARIPDADGFLMRADGSPAYKMRRTL